VTEAVSDFNDKVDELFTPLNAVAIKAINIEPQLRAMYSGRYDQEDIAAKLEELGYGVGSYDCTCEETYEIQAIWDYTATESPVKDSAERMQYVAAFFMPWIDDAGVRTYATTSGNYTYLATNVSVYGGGSPFSGSMKFYVQKIEFDWWAGPTCANKPGVWANGNYAPDGMPVPTPDGTYSKEWGSGSEPQVSSDQTIGLRAFFTTGNMDHLNDNGFITRLVISGFVAEQS
jgi:hypothetical protein